MKRATLVLAVMLVIALCGIAVAFNPNQTALRYYAYVPDANMPTVDGVFSDGEWDWVPNAFVYKMADYWDADQNAEPLSVAFTEPYTAEDFDVPFCFLGWNKTANTIVWGIQVVDDVFYAPQDYYNTWRGIDSIYWYMDADGDGGRYQYYDPARTGVDGQQGIFRYDEDPEGRSHLGCYGGDEVQWAFKPPYTQVGVDLDPVTGSATVEVTMQVFDWMEYESTGGADASTLHILEEGQILGSRFTIYDQDSDDENDAAMLTFNPKGSLEEDNAFTADDVAQWLLLSEEEPLAGQVAVESTTWGQVKALLK